MHGKLYDIKHIATIPHTFISVNNFNKTDNIIPKETATGIKLLLKLSNILYLESKFNGFNFLVPSFIFILFLSQLKICQSPLIHLLCLSE